VYWIFWNSAYIHLAYLNYYNGGIRRDIANNYLKDLTISSIFQCLAYNLYPYLVHYPFWWFWWLLLHTIHFYFMEDLFYIMLDRNSPFILVLFNIIKIILTMENHFWDLLMLANGLQVVRKVDTREEIHEIDSVTEKPSVPLKKKWEKIREELIQSLVEES
jgi:hypothetical protein